jgi:hypothetical protein
MTNEDVLRHTKQGIEDWASRRTKDQVVNSYVYFSESIRPLILKFKETEERIRETQKLLESKQGKIEELYAELAQERRNTEILIKDLGLFRLLKIWWSV